jgi:hypothetical protein
MPAAHFLHFFRRLVESSASRLAKVFAQFSFGCSTFALMVKRK